MKAHLPQPIPLHPDVEHSDAELVKRACDGDRWAREMIYRRHVGSLLSVASRLLASTADAEDAVQDAFISAFRDLHTLRDQDLLKSWLTRIVIHQVHRHFRRRTVRRVLRLEQEQTESGLAEQSSPDLPPDLRTELSLLDAVLRGLPAKHKVPWMLRHVDGYTLIEVAALCNCSLATTKRRIQQAHQVIKQHANVEELPDE